MNPGERAKGSLNLPPRHRFQDAVTRALAAIKSQTDEQLNWLGARNVDGNWTLAVLEDVLTLRQDEGRVVTSAGLPINPFWQVLTLHYLAVPGRPPEGPPVATFADLSAGSPYGAVYQRRVNERLCRTAGAKRELLVRAAAALGGRTVAGGDLGFEFQVFPRIRVRLLWYAGDDEFEPSATMLLPPPLTGLFVLEDIVVLSECLVARLGGRPFS